MFQRTPTQEGAPEEVTLVELVDVLSSEEKKAKDLLKKREYMQKYRLSKRGRRR
jgi:MarR-like DNA-binding transcriptional regulator SgrR of sgrS sRNA